MRQWYLADTAAARQALAIQQRLGSDFRRSLLHSGLGRMSAPATVRWMGSRVPAYLEEALRYFMLDFTLRLMKEIKASASPTQAEAMAIARKIPLVIPRALPSRVPPVTRRETTEQSPSFQVTSRASISRCWRGGS
jgi:hypothetical protein